MAPRKKIGLPKSAYGAEHVFYVTICTHERRPWFVRYYSLADRCVSQLVALACKRQSELFAWCVMPDHIHLLVRDRDLVSFVRLLKGRLTKEARQKINGQQFWQRSFYDRALRNEQSVLDVARYAWANPVREGLAKKPGDYAWSGSQAWPAWREDFGRG